MTEGVYGAGVFAQLQRASFGGIDFAVSRMSVKGSQRHHVHEFRHQAGGQPEKLGRKLYSFEFDCFFSSVTPLYPNAWPGDLFALRTVFELGITGDLVVPTIGTIKAFCTDWPTEADFGRRRDGETAKLTFLEDSEEVNLIGDKLNVGLTDLSTKKMEKLVEVKGPKWIDAFAAVTKLANEVQTMKDQVDLRGEQIADKCKQVQVGCQRLDESLDGLNDPVNHQIAAALHDLGVAAINLGADILRKGNPITTFILPARMAISDVSTALYGDTSKAMDLLRMNLIEDALSIPSGTTLRVYAAT